MKNIEDAELKQYVKNALAKTKGKHGRRSILQEERSLDDILIADDKQALKKVLHTVLDDMEHKYETAYIKAALIRSRHLASDTPFSVFLRAINAFSGKEYKYDQPNVSTPSSCMKRSNSRHPKVQNGKGEEESLSI